MLNTFIRVYVHNHKYIYPRQYIFVPFKEKKPSWVAKVRHTSSYAPKSFDNFVHRNFQ